MADTTKVLTCPTGQILKGGKCIPKVSKEVVSKLRQRYKTNPKTGVTTLGERSGKESPGYKKGKYWLRGAGKYTDIGSLEHKSDLRPFRKKKK